MTITCIKMLWVHDCCGSYAVPCGKLCVEGKAYCKEHQEEREQEQERQHKPTEKGDSE